MASIRVVILNRYYPPDLSPTGQAAQRLAEALVGAGFHVTVVATDAAYSHGAGVDIANPSVDILRLRSFYDGRNPILRLASSLIDGWRMMRTAVRRADAIVALTDPPLLVFWAGRMARRRSIPWIEWTMDLFPEAFAAAGLAPKANPVSRWLIEDFRRHLPWFRICLGVEQRDFVNATRGAVPAVIWPYGATGATRSAAAPSGRVPIVYAGNLGEAHDPAFVVRLVELADPARFVFWLAPRGARAGELRAALKDKPHVQFFDRLDDEQFASSAAHIVSLRPEWTHICVPSKAVGAVSAGKPIIFGGHPQSDNWVMLGGAGWLVPSRDGSYPDSAIRDALAAIADESSLAARTAAAAVEGARLRAQEHRAIGEIVDRLRQADAAPSLDS